MHALTLSLYLPSRAMLCMVYTPIEVERADTLTLFLLHPYIRSVELLLGTKRLLGKRAFKVWYMTVLVAIPEVFLEYTNILYNYKYSDTLHESNEGWV